MVAPSCRCSLLDLDAHLHAQLGVEVRERLVEEEDPRLAHDGAADGDALALAAGKLAGLAVEQLVDLQDLGGLRDAPLDLGLRRPQRLQAEGEVLAHRHVRVERVGLEHHREAALGRRDLVHRLAVDEDLAAGDLLEPGDHPQQRRLAAARRADEDDELAVLDVKVDAVDDLDRAEALDDAAKVEARHQATSRRLPAASRHRADGRGRCGSCTASPVRAE